MVIKGILEQITTSTVNLVNADLLAKNRGLRIRETSVFAEGKVGADSDLFVHLEIFRCQAASKSEGNLQRQRRGAASRLNA